MAQIINPELIDFNANVSHQITRELEFVMKLGLLNQDWARVIWGEWVIIEFFDDTISRQAQEYISDL